MKVIRLFRVASLPGQLATARDKGTACSLNPPFARLAFRLMQP
jgi:hypothetical protein